MHIASFILNPEKVLHDGVLPFPRLVEVWTGMLAFRVGEGTDL